MLATTIGPIQVLTQWKNNIHVSLVVVIQSYQEFTMIVPFWFKELEKYEQSSINLAANIQIIIERRLIKIKLLQIYDTIKIANLGFNLFVSL